MAKRNMDQFDLEAEAEADAMASMAQNGPNRGVGRRTQRENGKKGRGEKIQQRTAERRVMR